MTVIYTHFKKYFKDVTSLSFGSHFSSEKPAVIPIFVPLFVIVSFSWAAFKILSLYLVFSSLNVMCLGVGFVFVCFLFQGFSFAFI